jgi:HD superfamily phosphohydrolase
MHLQRIILLAFASLVTAKGNATSAQNRNETHHGNSERRQCSEMTQLTAILDLVNNSTKLMEFETRHNLSQADIDAIKTKATAEADRLKTLQSNTTLVQNCATIDAARQLKDECHQMTRLTELSNLADNQTALQEFQSEHHLTADEMTKFEARAKNATSKLAALQKNSTLVTACKAQKQNQSCKCTRPFRTYSTLYGSVCLEAAQVDLTERECGQKNIAYPKRSDLVMRH